MKTKVWLATIIRMDNVPWEGIFDFEISREQAIKESGLQNTGKVWVREISYYGRKLTALPEVTQETLTILSKNMKKDNWAKNAFPLLSLNQPIIYEYLGMTNTKYGQTAAIIGLVIFELIESQVERIQT